ncbi:MAG: hypothetical protein K2G73_09575, partial [Eubacterium sp.]|nr:hypothetical protein [Eubacterium sp.]
MLKNFLTKLTFKLRRKLKKISKKNIIIVLVISIVCSAPIAVYDYIKVSHTNYITLTLNYANARKGLTPTGGRFNIAELKSDEVLQSALNYLGDDSLSVEDIKDRITIDAKVPMSSIDMVKNAIANDTSYTYCPSEFIIYYDQGNKLERGNTYAMLNALANAYKDYFAVNYSEKNTILDYDIEDSLEKYDYGEQCQIMSDKVTAMLRYLDKYSSESNTFRSKSTGYSYSNLVSMLLNIRDVNLEKLEAYITQNGISEDKPAFLRKQSYNIEKRSLLYNKSNQGSIIAKDTMDIYNPHITGVAFVPSIDVNNEYYMGRTKTGLDMVVNDSYNDGLRAADLAKKIDSFQYLVDKYSSAPAAPQDAVKNAELMISEISSYIGKVSDLAIQTDNDYIESVSNNYITIIHHPISKMS